MKVLIGTEEQYYNIIKKAKKEVFDDIDKVLKEFSSFTTYDYVNDYRIKELKKKHLGSSHNTKGKCKQD